MYKGKEVCQGCGRDGHTTPRYSKEMLCQDCKKTMDLGKAINNESLVEYVLVRDWYHGFSSWDFDDSAFNNFVTDVLKAINNPNAPHVAEISCRPNYGGGAVFYKVPKAFAEPFIDFVKKVNDVVIEIRQQKETAKSYAQNAVKEEKNEIFNLGVEYGRDLLNQLNRGEITVDFFNKKVIKY